MSISEFACIGLPLSPRAAAPATDWERVNVNGKAHSAHLRLHARDGSLMLTVRDEGAGFHPADSPNGMGLRIMGHRASLLGGTLAIESQPGEGTTVTCTVPTGRPK